MRRPLCKFLFRYSFPSRTKFKIRQKPSESSRILNINQTASPWIFASEDQVLSSQVHVTFLVDEVILGNVFLAVLSFSHFSIILLLLYTDLHFNNALIIRTSGGNLGNLKKNSCAVSDVGEHRTVKYFQVSS